MSSEENFTLSIGSNEDDLEDIRKNIPPVKKQKKTTKKTMAKKTKENIEQNDISFETKLEEIKKAFRKNYLENKKITQEFKELMTLHKKDIKLAVKLNNQKKNKQSGFNKPGPVPSSLQKLLKIDDSEISRSEVTKLIYQYFRDKNMLDEENRKKIIPNKRIKKIFDMKEGDEINFTNLQQWLKKVYQKEIGKQEAEEL